MDDEGVKDEDDGVYGAPEQYGGGLTRPQRPRLGRSGRLCTISRFAVVYFELFKHCSLQSRVTTGHWSPEKKLLSTATTGFKSNTVEAKPSHNTKKTRGAIY